MPGVEVVDSPGELAAALAIRRRVFVEEQDVPEARERDGRDDEATHFLLRAGGEPVGTARLRAADDSTAKVERVAVLPERRGEGLGRQIMGAVEAHARERGFERVRLDAQVPVVGFYERLGYEVASGEFEDAGIPHRTMVKPLDDRE